ncbi:hypothetical protein ACIQUB_31010 [Rhizobium sp. NPDC090275]|uniref:hypothetical protein n=1 Tax=Rhizobium sp. NPDC090275 TaxID=3364498 RepID=UPI00383A6F70
MRAFYTNDDALRIFEAHDRAMDLGYFILASDKAEYTRDRLRGLAARLDWPEEIANLIEEAPDLEIDALEQRLAETAASGRWDDLIENATWLSQGPSLR